MPGAAQNSPVSERRLSGGRQRVAARRRGSGPAAGKLAGSPALRAGALEGRTRSAQPFYAHLPEGVIAQKGHLSLRLAEGS
jgi:hypothetical protein